jgi:3-oxoacyl-[acyl-carrier-protein] synthase III
LRYKNVCIEGLAHALPDEIVTSDWIEQQIGSVYKALDIQFGLIENLVGVKERRWWPEETDFSDAATIAGKRVLEKLEMSPEEPQVLVNTSVCHDYIEPATASIIHHKIGLGKHCRNFDVGNACLAFLDGMSIVADMIEIGHIDTGMVIAGECCREINNAIIELLLKEAPSKRLFYESMGALTLGSGAVAMILRHKDKSATGKRLLGGYSFARTEHHNLCVGQRRWGRLNAKEMLMAGLEPLVKTWHGFVEEFGWNGETIDRYFTHQVSNAHRMLGSQTIGVSLDGKDWPTLDWLGNIGPVSAPICMSMALEEDFVQDGDKVCLLGMGSGINAMMMAIQW